MRIDILTLFPAMFTPLDESIIKRARAKGVVDIRVTNIRDYTTDKHQTTDDRLYGGGAGMVMKPEPLFAAVEDVTVAAHPRVLITSPQGRPYDQALARELAQEEQVIIICGHYEGIDERVIETLATDVVSMGDFVLTGGEVPALAITDSITRLLPGALGDDRAAVDESFSESLLEYPQYTRPPVFRGMEVPQVLQNGNHAEIEKWRRRQSLQRTLKNRPDLLQTAVLSDADLAYLAELKAQQVKPFRLFVALVHYPVYNKKKQVVATSLTNLDLHDIARAACTYGAEGYYIIQPQEEQKKQMEELLAYWQQGFAASYNADRQQALALARYAATLDEAVAAIEAEYGAVQTVATSAGGAAGQVGYAELRRIMEERGGNYLLLLGTGWGLTDELLDNADYRLRPVYGAGSYNHLSVRSAASVILDRLMGER
ncbi:MAG: tRNA (guanosine(37)-N1)-methyltransferase TrmD [Firmicutes bacterium]|nr:tRNA (guanosine(37)-N1)-methyltransferase TrmD [Bacillota bacterium]